MLGRSAVLVQDGAPIRAVGGDGEVADEEGDDVFEEDAVCRQVHLADGDGARRVGVGEGIGVARGMCRCGKVMSLTPSGCH